MSRRQRNGLSLVEVLVVIVIVVILIGLMLPATRRVGGASHRSMCMNNLKQISLGLQNYADTGRKLPDGSWETLKPEEMFFPKGCVGPGTVPEVRLSWMVAILPFIDQDEAFRRFNLEKGFAENATADSLVQIYQCPSSPSTRKGETNYVAMAGIGHDAASRPAGAPGNGFMGYDRVTTFASITDGTSNTFALLETKSNLGPWAKGGASNLRGFDPADVPVQGDKRPFGGHHNHMLACFADGHIQSIPATTDPKILANAITIAGGEEIRWDD